MTFFTTYRTNEYSCVWILGPYPIGYLSFLYVQFIYKHTEHIIFLAPIKSTATPITDIYCINHTIPTLLMHCNIIWSALRTRSRLFIFCFLGLTMKLLSDQEIFMCRQQTYNTWFSFHDLVYFLILSYNLCPAQKALGIFYSIYWSHQESFLVYLHPINFCCRKPHKQSFLLPSKILGALY